MGRIVAIIDHLHNEYHNDTVGTFGFFECENDTQIANALLQTAESWLADHGRTAMRGPFCPSMKSEIGILVEGNDDPPMVMMPHTFAYYDQLLQQAGFQVVKNLYAFRSFSDDPGNAEKHEKLVQFSQKIMQRYPDLELRQIDKSTFSDTVRAINKLGNEKVRPDGWGFVPMTDAELDMMVRNLGRIINYKTFHVAYYKQQLVGYLVTIPDINWALRKTFFKSDWLRKLELAFWLPRIPRARLILLGADPAYRNKGIAMLLIKCLVDSQAHFKEYEFSWVLEDNIRSLRAIERSVTLDRYKTYRLYEKTIAQPN